MQNDNINSIIAKRAQDNGAKRFWMTESKKGDLDGKQFFNIKKRKWLAGKKGRRVSSVFSSRQSVWCVERARRLARGAGGEAFLKDSNGRIRAQNSYRENAPRKKA